jgi:hypothetical protein
MIVALLVFVCPHDFMSDAQLFSHGISAALCSSDSGGVFASHNGEEQENCFSSHLVVARQFVKNLINKINLLSIIFLATLIVYFSIFKTTILSIAQIKFTRFKYLFRFYVTHIKLECQKEFIAWLSLLENFHRVSAHLTSTLY